MAAALFAVPAAEGRICAHFGHCEVFTLVKVEDQRVTEVSDRIPPEHEPGVIPNWLHDLGVTHIIAGGMGRRAQDLFEKHGIQVVIGAANSTPRQAVESYLAGTLETGDNPCGH